LAVNAEGIDSQKAGELPLNSLFPDLKDGAMDICKEDTLWTRTK